MATQAQKTYDWGDAKINDYYNRNINTMSPNTIEASIQDLPEQTKESIQDQIRGYLNPAYEKALTSLKKQRDYEREYAQRDPNSRSASSEEGKNASDSAWHRMARRNLDVGESYARSEVTNNFLSNLAKGAADAYDKYLNRKVDYDTMNAATKLDVDMFNAKLKDAFEEMIYDRSVRRAKGKW